MVNEFYGNFHTVINRRVGLFYSHVYYKFLLFIYRESFLEKYVYNDKNFPEGIFWIELIFGMSWNI